MTDYNTRPSTPRDREVEKRLTDLEQVTAKIAKAVFIDDSMTQSVLDLRGPVTITNSANATQSYAAHIGALTKANTELRETVEKRDAEIVRLTHIIAAQDTRIDEYHDCIISVRVALDATGEGW